MRIFLLLAGLSLSLAAWPQEIYRWVDKDGVVHYSDQPGAPGAVRVAVIDPNTFSAEESTDAGSAADNGAGGDEEPQESSYQRLAIVQPQADQVFFGADATVTVAVELDGTLQPDHTLVFFVNGNRRPADGGLALTLSNLDRGSHFLRASVLDRNGQPLITSQQLAFHIREPSVNMPQSPQSSQRRQPAQPPPPVRN
ncbi:MAG: DUF4124 domain-containing protein [Gammaproteobacteria bacterium]